MVGQACTIEWLFRMYNCPCVRMTLLYVVLPQCTAHPDGSDIACQVEVKNCTGVPFQCRYVGPCPSNSCMADGDELETSKRERRAATSLSSRLWPSAVVPYVIEDNYTGESGCLGRRRRYYCKYFLQYVAKRSRDAHVIKLCAVEHYSLITCLLTDY